MTRDARSVNEAVLAAEILRMAERPSLAPLPTLEHIWFLLDLIGEMETALAEQRELSADLTIVAAALTAAERSTTT